MVVPIPVGEDTDLEAGVGDGSPCTSFQRVQAVETEIFGMDEPVCLQPGSEAWPRPPRPRWCRRPQPPCQLQRHREAPSKLRRAHGLSKLEHCRIARYLQQVRDQVVGAALGKKGRQPRASLLEIYQLSGWLLLLSFHEQTAAASHGSSSWGGATGSARTPGECPCLPFE